MGWLPCTASYFFRNTIDEVLNENRPINLIIDRAIYGAAKFGSYSKKYLLKGVYFSFQSTT